MAREIIYGLHAVTALLKSHPERLLELCVQQGRRDQRVEALLARAKASNVPVRECPREEIERWAEDAVHQGVIAFCCPAEVYSENWLLNELPHFPQPPLLLVLDGVQDPHNLGACLRTANAAGVAAVIVPKDRAVGLTPAVRKVACGAAELTPFVQVTNLSRTLRDLKEAGIWIYGTAGEATQSLYETDLRGAVALVMGAEEKGLRRLTRESCDVLVSLPMVGSVESLNVSVATGICLYEILRQRVM